MTSSISWPWQDIPNTDTETVSLWASGNVLGPLLYVSFYFFITNSLSLSLSLYLFFSLSLCPSLRKYVSESLTRISHRILTPWYSFFTLAWSRTCLVLSRTCSLSLSLSLYLSLSLSLPFSSSLFLLSLSILSPSLSLPLRY